ncbi:MAG TPA: chemotaxis protein CheB [Gammaproteobacteria bacterium]|nr:chemotaxis protein CheB [Gammaproteobacteria bacterium]
MGAQEHIKLRVAIASGSERQRTNLKSILEKSGLEVVINRPLNDQLLILIDSGQADVLLLDLDDELDQELSFLDVLLDRSSLPILFNDSASTRMDAASCNSDWGRALARKLIALVKEKEPAQAVVKAVPPSTDTGHTPVISSSPAATEQQHTPRPPVTLVSKTNPAAAAKMPAADGAAQQVWVLGASIGGPQAVKAFLAAIPADLPVAFVLAQHIGTGFAELLAEQLNNITPFHVLTAQAGQVLRNHQVVLAPVNEQFMLDARGEVQLPPLAHDGVVYRPSIDSVIIEVAQFYHADAGAIIFSGMGDDGLLGCEFLAGHGGTIWVQDAATCMISSMPDNVRKTGKTSFTGTPEQLARQLVKRLGHGTTYRQAVAAVKEPGAKPHAASKVT